MEIFKSISQNREFLKDGFVLVRGFLNEKECDSLNEFHLKSESQADVDLNFYTSIWSESFEYRKEVNSYLIDFIFPKVFPLLNGYAPVFSNFMVKNPGLESKIGFHQDWTFSDNPQLPAINLWIPLTDTTSNNGALKIIPRSQKLRTPIRARNLRSNIEDIPTSWLNTFCVQLEMKKGDAILFNENCIHGSDNNSSNSQRIAVSLVLHNCQTPIVHYVFNETNGLKRKVVEPSFFFQFGLSENFIFDNSFLSVPNRNTKNLKFQFLLNQMMRLVL